MIDTRTMAVVIGVLSLVLGVGTAIASAPALGVAAGTVGLLAGAMAFVGTRGGDTAGAPPVEQPHTQGTTGAAHLVPGPAPATGPDDAAGPATTAPGSDDPYGAPLRSGQTTGTGHFDLDGPGEGISGTKDPTPSAGLADPVVLDGGVTEIAPSAPVPSGAGTTDRPAPEVGPPLTDPGTGLFSHEYLTVALEGRLASARRHLRPVALAVMTVNRGLPDSGPTAADPAVVAKAIRDTVRDSDIACRLDDGSFGIILEDTPENGAVWTVERIRRNLVSSSGHHTLWAGVACYPAHAFDTEELMRQVTDALVAAREWNQDRIEVALAE